MNYPCPEVGFYFALLFCFVNSRLEAWNIFFSTTSLSLSLSDNQNLNFKGHVNTNCLLVSIQERFAVYL